MSTKVVDDRSLQAQQQSEGLSPVLTDWLQRINAADETEINLKKSSDTVTQVIYGLKLGGSPRHQELYVDLYSQNLLKSGRFSKPKPQNFTAHQVRRWGNALDCQLCAEIFFYQSEYMYSGQIAYAPLLANLLSTGRCYWQGDLARPLALGCETTTTFGWQLSAHAEQHLVPMIGETFCDIIWLGDSPWYFLEQEGTLGPAQFTQSPEVVKTMLECPSLEPSQTKQLAKVPHAHLGTIPPRVFEQVIEKTLTPCPVVKLCTLSCEERQANGRWVAVALPGVQFSIDYEGERVDIDDRSEALRIIDGNQVTEYVRNPQAERESLGPAIMQLDPANTDYFFDLRVVNETRPRTFLLDGFLNEELQSQLLTELVPELQAAGFIVECEGEFFQPVIDGDELEWFSDFESQDNDFFRLSLGVEIEGQAVDIMPAVIEALQRDVVNQTTEKDELIVLNLSGDKKLKIPFERIEPIVKLLTSLFDTEKLKPSDDIFVSRTQAALMYEMKLASAASKLRWRGAEKLMALGKTLAEKKIKIVKAPAAFKASLREYQQQGVNWLQFLREHQFGGVLADDMGLGKTVQTLAHLSVEKTKKRLTKPCLIVAPTSLMTNWQQESARFAPTLKTLVYHGDKRKKHLDSLTDYDLIFTTYDLVARDKAALLETSFYYLILDEAQRIKNAKAKTTQVIMQISAEHRLCLTGTPMENHLGELWSLFHFLMPGFLGDSKTFSRIYRTPIEKHQQLEVSQRLALRLQPFMLRRLKTEVAAELPDKTEMVRYVELSGRQRDIYESIRLTMEAKVRKAIASKGLSRSHIEILDALLKLRQTCCSPQLLKVDEAKVSNSEKLSALCELVPALIEEGRRILIFSQFTSMLSLIGDALKAKGIDFIKLTGQSKNRQTIVDTFQNGTVPVFLISLKAGGVGLNLTAADTVIHYDPWWNPAAEDQATDRSHRIGQQQAVFVYKLIAKGTVEETILQMQEKKRGLMAGLLEPSQANKLKLSEHELLDLFKPIDA